MDFIRQSWKVNRKQIGDLSVMMHIWEYLGQAIMMWYMGISHPAVLMVGFVWADSKPFEKVFKSSPPQGWTIYGG